DVRTTPALMARRGRPTELWQALFPRAETVVVCPAEPREQLLQAGCLAGALRAPLFVLHEAEEYEELRQSLDAWQTRRIVAVGSAAAQCEHLSDISVSRLANAQEVAA